MTLPSNFKFWVEDFFFSNCVFISERDLRVSRLMLFFRLPIFIKLHDVEIPWSAYNICKPVLNFYLQLLAFFSFLIFLKSLVQTCNGATFTINIFFCVIKVSTLHPRAISNRLYLQLGSKIATYTYVVCTHTAHLYLLTFPLDF